MKYAKVNVEGLWDTLFFEEPLVGADFGWDKWREATWRESPPCLENADGAEMYGIDEAEEWDWPYRIGMELKDGEAERILDEAREALDGGSKIFAVEGIDGGRVEVRIECLDSDENPITLSPAQTAGVEAGGGMKAKYITRNSREG